jgi:hypothetical protein
MGSLAAGGAATIGTGAFTDVTASRTVSVSVADDSDALLALDATSSNDNSAYAYEGGGNEISIDITDANDSGFSSTDPNGLNANATTNILDIFDVENQGTQPVFVYVDGSSITPQWVRADGDDDGNDEYGSEGQIYVDPQATNRPQSGSYTFGTPVSMTGVYGSTFSINEIGQVNDPNDGNDMVPETLTLGPGESLSFGLQFQVAEDNDFTGDITMPIVADADLAELVD